DPITRESLQDDLIKLQHEIKKTIVFVTHDIQEAMKLGDRICLFNEGRIEQIGTPEEFKKHPKNKFVEEFIGNLIEQRDTAGDFVSDKHVTDNIDGYPEIESNMDIKRSEERRVGKECRYRE